MRLLKT